MSVDPAIWPHEHGVRCGDCSELLTPETAFDTFEDMWQEPEVTTDGFAPASPLPVPVFMWVCASCKDKREQP